MRLVFILYFILSSSSQAFLVKNGVSDYKDQYFVDGSGNEAPLKLLLTKVSFPDGDRNETPNSHAVLLDQSLRFGEVLEINFADYFPNLELGDDVFLSAFFNVEANHKFAKERETKQIQFLTQDDTLVFWADVFFASDLESGSTALQQFYIFKSYVEEIEQARPDLSGPDDYVSEEELSS